LLGLGDILVEVANNHEHHNRKKGREKGSQRVVGTTILVHLDNALGEETNDIHPRDRGGEGETTNNRSEGLDFNFGGNTADKFLAHFYI